MSVPHLCRSIVFLSSGVGFAKFNKKQDPRRVSVPSDFPAKVFSIAPAVGLRIEGRVALHRDCVVSDVMPSAIPVTPSPAEARAPP